MERDASVGILAELLAGIYWCVVVSYKLVNQVLRRGLDGHHRGSPSEQERGKRGESLLSGLVRSQSSLLLWQQVSRANIDPVREGREGRDCGLVLRGTILCYNFLRLRDTRRVWVGER
ncbi:hypothetical protein AMTR_s00163p00055600, partial [Amborella trichopoda]